MYYNNKTTMFYKRATQLSNITMTNFTDGIKIAFHKKIINA